MVLQKCVENISGISFPDFMEKKVLIPLDMADGTFRRDISGNFARGYTADNILQWNGYDLMPEQATAGLWTMVADLA